MTQSVSAAGSLPQSCAPSEIKLETTQGEQFELVEALRAGGQFPGALSINDLDGVRVDYADGFGLARPSNTTPTVVLRFKGYAVAALARIEEDFRNAFRRVASISVYRSKEHHAMGNANFAREAEAAVEADSLAALAISSGCGPPRRWRRRYRAGTALAGSRPCALTAGAGGRATCAAMTPIRWRHNPNAVSDGFREARPSGYS